MCGLGGLPSTTELVPSLQQPRDPLLPITRPLPITSSSLPQPRPANHRPPPRTRPDQRTNQRPPGGRAQPMGGRRGEPADQCFRWSEAGNIPTSRGLINLPL